MKNLSYFALSGMALMQGAAAVCCRSNQCLKAIVSAGPDALVECAEHLVVTVTPAASTLTETVTVVESGVATELFTETRTVTALTETLLFTESITVTATQSEIATATSTVTVTTTNVQLAPAVTSTSTGYAVILKARQTVASVPDYASNVCADFNKYTRACLCAGAEATTITVPATTTTVTVTADTAVTTTVSTLSSTVTATVSATATTSSTLTAAISVTETVSSTETVTVTTTTTVLATSTLTSIVPLACRQTGRVFRASTPFADGSTRYMNALSTFPAWQGTSQPDAAPSLKWVLDSAGYLETAGSTSVMAAYVDLSATSGASVRVFLKPKPDVEAAVAAGTYVRVKGCVEAATGEVKLSAVGRHNILSCGNAMYLSTGDGKDVRSDCQLLFPKAWEY